VKAHLLGFNLNVLLYLTALSPIEDFHIQYRAVLYKSTFTWELINIIAFCIPHHLIFLYLYDSATAVKCEMSGQDASDLDRVSTPQLFYTYFYNHAHRLRLEKLLLLYLEPSRRPNGFF
jgi:hypothetical protein